MELMRKIIEINEELCDGCGQCVPGCAEGALEIVDNKARLVEDRYCDGLGACIGDCPTGALKIIEREADDFDEEAVEIFLKQKKAAPAPPQVQACISAKLQTFQPTAPPCQAANQPTTLQATQSLSALTHWPVQIRLVPPTAPFLKGADLLVAADCTPIAYPHFHRDFLKNRAVLVGCPKFDNVNSYIRKFADIFVQAAPKNILIAIMEVPCCAGMRMIINEALKLSGADIPVQEVVISVRGEILRQEENESIQLKSFGNFRPIG